MNDSATPGQPEYLQAWSLRRHPFKEGLDAQFFYAGSTLMQRLDLLTHLVQFSESIVVVSGPPGSGKSTLLEQFLGHINPHWTVCQMDGEQGDKLADQLAQTIGVEPGEDEQALLTHWVAQSDPAQQMIIVLDDAEKLDDSACRRLCELTDLADGDRLRIVLFGTANTLDRVRTLLEQVTNKRTCQTLELPKLTEEETAAYLMYRLAVAGYSGESPFTPTEVRAICKSADGRPGQINRLAHESLVEHHMRAKIKKRAPVQRSRKKNATPLWVGASLVIIALAGYLGWQRIAPTEAPYSNSTPPEFALVEQPLALPESVIDDGVKPQAEPPRSSGQQRTETASPDTDKPIADKPVATATPVITPPIIDAPSRPAKTSETGARPAADTTAPATIPATTTPDTVVKNSSTPEITPETPTTPAAEAHTTSATEPVAAPPSSQPVPTPAAEPPHRENWLLQQPPDTFTLQLLGSRDQASIANYIRRHALEPEKTAWYRGRYRGSEWYVLLYGNYPDKAAALAARNTLPGKVQKAKPWPRSLKSVQDSIREVQ